MFENKAIKSTKTYYEQYLYILKHDYTKEDAKNVALDTTVIKILSSLIKETTIFKEIASLKDVTKLLKALPKHIEMSEDNYAYIAYDYLTNSLPCKQHIRAIGITPDRRADELTLQILNYWNAPIMIKGSDPNLYYSDNECRFLSAITPIVLSRDYMDVQEEILRNWSMDLNGIYLDDTYRHDRISETLTAAYNNGKGYVHITELDTGKNSVIAVDGGVL